MSLFEKQWTYTSDQVIKEFKDFPIWEALKRLDGTKIFYFDKEVILEVVSVEKGEDLPLVTLIAYCRFHQDKKSKTRTFAIQTVQNLIAIGQVLVDNYKQKTHPPGMWVA